MLLRSIAIVLSTFIAPSIQQNIYTQVSSFQQDMCASQPLAIVSQLGGGCTIPGTPMSSCTSFGGVTDVYASQRTLCSSKPLDMSGVVQLFVAEYSWTNNSACSGNPQSVIAYMADALCKPIPRGGGPNSYGFINVNCNGGRPIYMYCKDPSCSDCVQHQYSGKCEISGAMASSQHVCVRPSGGSGGGILIDVEESGALAATVGGALSALATSLMAALVF